MRISDWSSDVCSSDLHARNIGCARLEPLRHIGIGAALEADGMDHVAAALPGRHVFEHLVTGIQRTHAGRPIQLVPRENVEVAAYGLHINHLMGHHLCAIAPYQRTCLDRTSTRLTSSP